MKSEEPLVGVMLAVFNGVRWLNEQIQTILHQKNVRVKIFISIDASSDGSEDFCLKLAQGDSRIVILPTGLKFGFAGRNFFRLIKDVDIDELDFCAFADQDDIWFPEKLSNAVNKIVQHSADGYSSNVLAFWPDGRKKIIDKTSPQTEWDFLFESAGPGCTYVLPVATWKKLKESVVANSLVVKDIKLHDWYAYAFVRALKLNWFVDPEPSMYYRQHSNNEFGANSGFKTAWRRLQAVRSGWYRHQAAEMCRIFQIDGEISKSIQNGYVGSMHLLKNLTELRRRPIDRFFLGWMLLLNFY